MQSKTLPPPSLQTMRDEPSVGQREPLLRTSQAMLSTCAAWVLSKCKHQGCAVLPKVTFAARWPCNNALQGRPLRLGLLGGHSKPLGSLLHSGEQRRGQTNQGALPQTGGGTTSLLPSHFHIRDGPGTQEKQKYQMLPRNKHTQGSYREDQCRPCSILSTPWRQGGHWLSYYNHLQTFKWCD